MRALAESLPDCRRIAPGRRVLQRPVLPARSCRAAAAASAAGSTGTAYADSAAPHADKPNEQRTITQLVNSILPQPEQLIAVALAATLGLLATRVFDGKGVHGGTYKESHLARLPNPPPPLLYRKSYAAKALWRLCRTVLKTPGANCPGLRAGLLLGLGLLSSYFARFAAPVLVVLAAARGSSHAPSLTPLFAFASAVFACRWYLFNQCASRPFIDDPLGSNVGATVPAMSRVNTATGLLAPVSTVPLLTVLLLV